MLSADRYMAEAARCRELGLHVFLTKPLGQSELLDAILSVLGVREVEERLVEAPASVPDNRMEPSLRILLAEDNPVNQKLAVRLLERAGHHVVLASNGMDALTAWKNAGTSGFEIVLMDIQMPELDGMETTAAIRVLEKNTGTHIPIVAMTAHAMRGDKERYLASGMDGYISKPIHPPALFDEIRRCLAETGRNKMPKTELHEPSEYIDRRSLLERVEGDHELLAEMITLFLEDAPRLLAAMRDALARSDMPVLERTAHSMKGAASNLSAPVTTAAAFELEKSAKSGDSESSKESLAKLESAVQKLLPALKEICQGAPK